VIAAGTLSLPEAVALDDDLVGVVGEPIEGALRQDRIVEERDPLLDGAVAGQHRGPSPMPLQDHFVEVAGLLRVESAQAEVVDDEHVGSEQPPQHLLGGVIGPGLVQHLEEAIGTQEEHVLAGAAGRVSECRSEEGLADADGSQEDHVLLPFDEAETEEVSDAIAIEGDGGVPDEALERLVFIEAGTHQPQAEALVVATLDFVGEHELEEVELREFRLPGVRHPVGQRRQQA